MPSSAGKLPSAIQFALPDHFGNLTPVGGKTGPTALGQVVVDVPESRFQIGSDWDGHGRVDVLDEVAVPSIRTSVLTGRQRAACRKRLLPTPVIGERPD